jgi:hypothetical protein
MGKSIWEAARTECTCTADILRKLIPKVYGKIVKLKLFYSALKMQHICEEREGNQKFWTIISRKQV